MINKLCIIGVGLIGGSLAKALKQHHYAKQIMGFGRNEKSLKLAKKLNIIDNYTLNIQEAVVLSDIIIIATPVNSFETILAQIKPYLSSNMLISDVGSTKSNTIKSVQNILGYEFANFIPAHPIAGKEKTGSTNADENLFTHKKVIITPYQGLLFKNLHIIKTMWQLTGAVIEEMDANVHDNIFALTSHLPHILAFSFVNYMATQQGSEEYTGGGFKDFSRIASSNSKMWVDICLNNKIEILKHLKNYQQEIAKLANFIKNDEIELYEKYFNNAKTKRDSWLKN